MTCANLVFVRNSIGRKGRIFCFLQYTKLYFILNRAFQERQEKRFFENVISANTCMGKGNELHNCLYKFVKLVFAQPFLWNEGKNVHVDSIKNNCLFVSFTAEHIFKFSRIKQTYVAAGIVMPVKKRPIRVSCFRHSIIQS